MGKVEQYRWKETGKKGVFRQIHIDDLFIDHSYQRGEVKKTKILTIARDFKWASFGALDVSDRGNGEYWVIDGQQRLAGLRRREYKGTVPCLVYALGDGEGDIFKKESDSFYDRNVRRTPVNSICKFRSRCISEAEPETTIERELKNLGLFIGNGHGSDPQYIGFPTRLVSTWKESPEQTIRAIVLQRTINRGQILNEEIHIGIFWLLVNGVDVGKYVESLIQRGGKEACLCGIHAEMRKSKKLRASVYCAGIGILEEINTPLRKKIQIKAKETEQK
jgi:hypothetical protein